MTKNKCIKCTIDNCKHHFTVEDYCTLSSICIGTHEVNPQKAECTDCNSFELKK